MLFSTWLIINCKSLNICAKLLPDMDNDKDESEEELFEAG
jgi:hypothetical protein